VVKKENSGRDEFDDWIDAVCEADPIDDDLADDEVDHPFGPPLTTQDIDEARSNLAKWQAPKAFKDDVLALCRRCPSSEYFRSPHLKFLHDAYVLAKFASKMAVDKVRLAASGEQWPDGYIESQGTQFNIEVTSTHGGRRLGDEYGRVVATEVVHYDPIDEWVARADLIPPSLDRAISLKANKSYGSPCWLVVYLNINEWGIRQALIERVIAETITKYAASFQHISVLWKGTLYSTAGSPLALLPAKSS
jgi:hypothetical protein